MSVHRLQVTAGPFEGAAVHVDLATDTVAAQSDGFDLGSPDASFDLSGRPVEESREVTIPLLIKGQQAMVGQVMGDVARAVSVRDRWLLVQRTPSTDPAWFRITPRSPGSFSMSNAYVDSRSGFWSWTLTLTVDSTAVGARRAVPKRGTVDATTTVPNAGVSRGLVIDAPGEAPMPLRVDLEPNLSNPGKRPMVATFSVPWDSPLVNGGDPAVILEDTEFSSISGHSTRTTGSTFLSGGTGITMSLDTTANRQLAVTKAGSSWRPEPGRYLVLARFHREGSFGEFKVRMGQSWFGVTAMQDWRPYRPSEGGWRASWMPVGYLQHPIGDDGEGLLPSEIMPPSIRFDVTPTVTNATTKLHLDQVAFVPVELARGANLSACFADFQPGTGAGNGIRYRFDGEARRVAIVDYVGQYHAVPAPLRTGGWPVATPGMATCVVVFLDTTDAPTSTDSGGATIQMAVTLSGSPRLLHLGQER